MLYSGKLPPARAIPLKLFTAVIYAFLKLGRAFVPDKPFQLSLMFASKARAFQSEGIFMCSTLRQAPSLTHKH
jgi:hypothetical protein